jgi:hypothetical protein
MLRSVQRVSSDAPQVGTFHSKDKQQISPKDSVTNNQLTIGAHDQFKTTAHALLSKSKYSACYVFFTFTEEE